MASEIRPAVFDRTSKLNVISGRSQFLSQMYQSRSFGISKRLMCGNAQFVAHLGVGCHFLASFLSCPLLGYPDEFPADPAASNFGLHIPAFKISDVVGLAIFDEWANANLKKSDQFSGLVFSNEDELRIGGIDDVDHFRFIIGFACCVPQTFA